MNNYSGTMLIIAVCIVVLLIGAVRGRAEWLLNFVLRSILGTIAIYFINILLEKSGISLGIGINPATVLTSGLLGIPGLLALYGIGICKLL